MKVLLLLVYHFSSCSFFLVLRIFPCLFGCAAHFYYFNTVPPGLPCPMVGIKSSSGVKAARLERERLARERQPGAAADDLVDGSAKPVPKPLPTLALDFTLTLGGSWAR